MEIDNIRNSIKKYYPVTDKSIDLLSKHFKAHNFPAKHLIIRGGVIDRNVYFIEKGLTRSYCIVDGNEHTTWFSKEGDITFGLLCLYHNKAGFEFVETVEPTLAYSIPINILLYCFLLLKTGYAYLSPRQTTLPSLTIRVSRSVPSSKMTVGLYCTMSIWTVERAG